VPLVDVATAKLHLRVTSAEEDARITAFLAAAEEQVTAFLGRNVYATQGDLDAARAAAPDVSAATTTYGDALTASAAVVSLDERLVYQRRAEDVYRGAIETWERTGRGMVANESIRTAILLITASLWEHRGDEDAAEGIPQAAYRCLWPWRAGVGI
jgi:hypothetical protein